MKHVFTSLLVLLLFSCTKNQNDPNSWQPQDPIHYQDPNRPQDNTSLPDVTSPVYSGMVPDDVATSEDNVALTDFDGTISVRFSQTGADISGQVDDVRIQNEGAHVRVVNSGSRKVCYRLSGTSSDGSFTLYSDKKQAIVLSDLTLENPNGAAVNNQSKKRTFIELEGTSSLRDGQVDASGDYPDEKDDEDMKAALFSEGQLVFSGSGSLEVFAQGKSGITSDDYVRLMPGVNVKVTSKKGHGVRGKDAVILSGGTLDVTLESTATGKKCLTTDSLIYMTGGTVSLVNRASAGMVDSELTGASGIKADRLFVIQGGELRVEASGKGGKCISGDGNGFFEGGVVNVSSSGANYGSSGRFTDSDNSVSAKSVKFDGNLEFTGADVTAVCASHEAIEAKGTIHISSGTISAASSDDAINSGLSMTISGGVVYAVSSGNDGLDANGDLIISDGAVYAVGCGNPEVALDANTEEGHRLYIIKGYVIAAGGIESGSSVSQPVISTSWNRNTTYALMDGDQVLFAFRTPSSGGTGLLLSAPSLVEGSAYSLRSSGQASGGKRYFDGVLQMDGTVTGGTSVSVTASAYSSNGQGGMGPGWGPSGPGGGGF